MPHKDAIKSLTENLKLEKKIGQANLYPFPPRFDCFV